METKKMIWGGMVVGSAIGGFLPMIWGGSELSMSGVIFTAIGGFIGIWVGYKLSQ